MVPKSGWPVTGQTLVNSGQTMSMVKSRPGRGFGKVSSWSADGVSGESMSAALGCGRRRVDTYCDRWDRRAVPARNTILLGLALGYAEVVGAFDLFIGASVLDYSGCPDCRPEFLTAFEGLANLATKAGVEGGRFRVHSPLLRMTKAEIIREGTRLGVDYSQTLSCYDPDPAGRACGRCDSCQLRKKGFAEAGIPDPTTYQVER